MQTYCLIKICTSQAALYQNLTSKSRSWRILNTENPTRIQPLHPMQATLRHRLLSLDPSHQRRKSMSGSSYDCPKQSVQISDFKLKCSNPKLCQNWWFEHLVTMQLCIWCESMFVQKKNMTRSESHWALCICAHDSQDVAGLQTFGHEERYVSHWTGS